MGEPTSASEPLPKHEQNFVIPNENYLLIAQEYWSAKHNLPEHIDCVAPFGWLIRLWPYDAKELREMLKAG